MADLRVVLADDHGVVRAGLKLLVDSQPEMTVVGEAGDGREAWEQVQALQPDVLIVDISMPQLTGTKVTAHLKTALPAIKVIALSVHEELSYIRAMLEAGADGYVLKRSAGEVLIEAIRAVVAGGQYLDPSLTPTIAQHLGRRRATSADAPASLLSEREAEVLRLVAQGYLSKAIAAQLGVGSKTVDTYRLRAMEKLGLSSRAALVRYALEQGWLSEP
jgi:two-component system, NarL family, response regulator NreC